MFIEILGLWGLLIFLFVGFLILWIFKPPYYVGWGLNFKAPWYWHLYFPHTLPCVQTALHTCVLSIIWILIYVIEYP